MILIRARQTTDERFICNPMCKSLGSTIGKWLKGPYFMELKAW